MESPLIRTLSLSRYLITIMMMMHVLLHQSRAFSVGRRSLQHTLTTPTTVGWMSSTSSGERTEEEQAAIKAQREARK